MTVRSSALRLAQRVVSGGLTVVLVPAPPAAKSAVVWQPPSASAPASAAPIQGFIDVPQPAKCSCRVAVRRDPVFSGFLEHENAELGVASAQRLPAVCGEAVVS